MNRTLTIRPKPELGFRTKNDSVRVVPIPQVLVDALKTYVLTIPTRRLIFTNASGGAEGHFLKKCKALAKRAGLNCGHCVNKKGLSCFKHLVCDNWTLHKFRRTWATNHMLNGVPLPVIQQWIGVALTGGHGLDYFIGLIGTRGATRHGSSANVSRDDSRWTLVGCRRQ
jgi:integrase/recombinase XerD